MIQGVLLVVCGPSGVGKGTVCRALIDDDCGIQFSVSATTRSPRTGEEHGKHYYFMDKEQFRYMIEREEFLEWAEVHGNLYGTPSTTVLDAIEQGCDVLLEIDVQGALQVKANFHKAVMVFLLPPDMNELERRIRSRATETEEEIQKRLLAAREEIAALDKFDYVIINNTIEESCQQLKTIVQAERLKTHRSSVKDGDMFC